jgi:hypothetical protein
MDWFSINGHGVSGLDAKDYLTGLVVGGGWLVGLGILVICSAIMGFSARWSSRRPVYTEALFALIVMVFAIVDGIAVGRAHRDGTILGPRVRFRTGLLVVVAGAVLMYVAGVIRDATEPTSPRKQPSNPR